MTHDIIVEAALGEVGAHPAGIAKQRKGAAGLRGAAVANRQRMGDQAKPIALHRAPQIGQRRRIAAITAGKFGTVGQQRKLRGDIGHRRCRRLWRREQRLLAGRLDRVAGAGVETGKRRARHQRAVGQINGPRLKRAALDRKLALGPAVENEPGHPAAGEDHDGTYQDDTRKCAGQSRAAWARRHLAQVTDADDEISAAHEQIAGQHAQSAGQRPEQEKTQDGRANRHDPGRQNKTAGRGLKGPRKRLLKRA